ncbi:MAG: hypothetical protein VYA30_14970 [Myxococcota bacterium]|nr:hypothetical protein [Myxococcota bacterium]
MSASEARSIAFFSRPFSPSARRPSRFGWVTESIVAPGTYLRLLTVGQKTAEGSFVELAEDADTLVLEGHGQRTEINFSDVQVLAIAGTARPVAGLLTGAFVGSVAGFFLSQGSTDPSTISKTFVTSLTSGMLIGLSVGLISGLDTQYFLDPTRRRLSRYSDFNQID